jgi:hypothetical protein
VSPHMMYALSHAEITQHLPRFSHRAEARYAGRRSELYSQLTATRPLYDHTRSELAVVMLRDEKALCNEGDT